MGDKALMNTYGEKAMTLVSGDGAWLHDEKGNKYLDALSGIAVCGLGHSHPEISKVISDQAKELIHCSNFFAIPSQQQLAKKLCGLSGMTNVFFGNSGAEANEAAIKIARLHGNKKGIKLPTVLVMDNAFHGRTLATLTASGSRKIQAGFEPLVSGFVRGPFNDIQALKKIADNNPDICAIFVEPIQGEGGINLADPAYFQQLRDLCDELGWLLMFDEVQSGNGRTGKYFYYQHSGVQPDVVTTAKGLGNGMPIGACLAHGAAAELMQPGNHGSTFGGNPLAMAVANAVLDGLEEDGFLVAVRERIASLDGYLTQLQNAWPEKIIELRGAGLLRGLRLGDDIAVGEVTRALRERYLLCVPAADNVLRLLPPLTISEDELAIVQSALEHFFSEVAAA